MWGTAGTLARRPRAPRRHGRGALAARLRRERARRCSRGATPEGLWTQRRFKDTRSLGPVHGFVGNVHALLTALDGERAERLRRETNDTLTRFAVREGALCNWPPAAEERLEHRRTGEIRLQWCHGAPGIVTTTAPYLDEELLLAGAELTWPAGAHRERKGAGICHGTAGNGYALLAAFARTGDELWLERARRFAVHALAQAEREPPVYSLWLGGDRGRALRLRLPRRGLPLPVPRARGRAMMLYQPEGHEPLAGELGRGAGSRRDPGDRRRRGRRLRRGVALAGERLGLVADADAAEVALRRRRRRDLGARRAALARLRGAADRSRGRGRGDARGVAARARPDGRDRAALDEGVRPALGRDRDPPRRLRPDARAPSSPTTSTSACARTSRARRRT